MIGKFQTTNQSSAISTATAELILNVILHFILTCVNIKTSIFISYSCIPPEWALLAAFQHSTMSEATACLLKKIKWFQMEV